MNKITLVIASLLILATSCAEKLETQSQEADYFFHVKEAGAFLPVWVRGNVASGKILIYIQGGPGLNTMDFATVDFAGWEESLERDYAIAYYDHRGTGNAQGDYDLSSITLDQYLLDLRRIVQVMQNQYPNKEIYLFGHSFGGWLAYLYNVRFDHDPLISGIIAANAPFTTDHNEQRWKFRSAFLERVAQDFITEGRNVAYWTEVLEWIQTHKWLSDREQRRQWNRYVIQGLEEYQVEPPISTGKVLKGVFASSINIFPTLFDLERLDQVSDQLFKDQLGIDLHQNLRDIRVPLLMITGAYDDIAPPEEFEFVFDQIGSRQKHLEVLPEAGHDAMINQPELFRQAINSFLD